LTLTVGALVNGAGILVVTNNRNIFALTVDAGITGTAV